MCTMNDSTSADNKEDMEGISSNSDSDSDVSMSSSDSDKNKVDSEQESDENAESSKEENMEEKEDELVKAVKRESQKKSIHPPTIICEDFVTDISFHPQENVLAVASIVGDVILYKYSNEENTELRSLELHVKACRDVEFSLDGKTLFSASKDKTIMLSDVETGKLVRFYENSHECPLYCLRVIDENLFATGDDNGHVKLWDLRQKSDKQVYKFRKHEDYISAIITNEANDLLFCTSGDGSMTTVDLTNRKVLVQTIEYEEEFTCLGLFRTETKIVTGTSKGRLYMFNFGEFGLHSDSYPGPKFAINAMLPITENICLTAGEDGVIRASYLFPHKHLGIVGQHDLSVENIDICSDGEYLASSGHNNEIKFWNMRYFEDIERENTAKSKKHERKKDLQNNLPSSKVKNASDFFSDL